MSTFVKVTGANELAIVARRLKQAGEGQLRRELLAGLRAGAKPLIPLAKQAARNQLPKRGGLAARVASEPMSVRIRTGGRNPSVRIVTTTTDTRGANRGVIRHPVFGHRDRFVSQPFPRSAGWFDQTLSREGPAVADELRRTLQKVADQLGRRL